MIEDLPEWALNLVYQLLRSEYEHPTYYRFMGGNPVKYGRVDCPQRELLALVPDEVQTAVRLAAVWSPKIKENV